MVPFLHYLDICVVGFVELYPKRPYSVEVYFLFYITVLQKYWVLTDSRIQLITMLRGMRVVTVFINSHEQSQ